VNRVLARQPEPPPAIVPATILLKKGHESVPVAIDDITYIEAFGAYSKVHLFSTQPVLVSHLLTELETRLPAAQFARVHRSFMVAVTRISSFSNNQLMLGERQIPVSRTYQAALRQALDKRINP
jgi:DNA-binding LytR/AlgR family response regulator